MSFFSNKAAVFFEQKDYEGCIDEVSSFILILLARYSICHTNFG